jgi:hypothetical protein
MPAFDADLPAMLADFGEQFTAGSSTFKALFDSPDEVISLPGSAAVSRQFEITYITTAVVLKRNDAVTGPSGQAFRVREEPMQLGDGAFTKAVLSRA